MQGNPSLQPQQLQENEVTETSEGVEGKGSDKLNVGFPTLSLPKGGGAIQGIGEKFQPDPFTGTGSLNVPIFTTPGRNDFSPQLSLSYSSGGGNGPFGMGWNLSIPSITRKTAKGLPRYQDSDTFVLSGAEDLVPKLKEENGTWLPEVLANNGYEVRRFVPRIEGLFARIEMWIKKSNGDTHWRSITRENVTSFYGETNQARISHPQSTDKIFSWLLERTEDNKGSVVHYTYKKEDLEFPDSEDLPSIRPGSLAEKHRGQAVNLYIKSIEYGNRAFSENKPFDSDKLKQEDWHFQVVFDYGDHEGKRPEAKPSGYWFLRKDPFSSFRSRFEIRNRRLCHRVLMFHYFPADLGNDQVLVRSTDFNYHENEIATKLTSVTQTGYPKDQRFNPKQLPPLEFQYSEPVISKEIASFDTESLDNLPSGIDAATFRLIDLDGVGLPGILTEQNDEFYYKENRGEARFGPLYSIPSRPTLTAAPEGAYQLNDLDGNGRLSLVSFAEPLSGYWERTEDFSWEGYASFKFLPEIDWQNPNLQWIDLNGDGFADILIAQDDCFVWYPSKAKNGFGEARVFPKPKDEEKGPALVFADGTQSIYLADMSGDGLLDIVRITNGLVCYWPHTGYGSFGVKLYMENAPHFNNPDRFQSNRIRLTDIDGSGTTDIIYLSDHQTKIYFNQAGNGFSQPQVLLSFPQVDNLTSVQTADLLGKGTSCLVWSSPLPDENNHRIRYIDLMRQGKPHLLTKVINNLGAETTVTYKPSTYFYLKDQKEGKPWITRLPFPVQVIERIEIEDKISHSRYVSRFTYHHGYFDGQEREFRGFGRVEQIDTDSQRTVIEGVEEVLMQDPVLTKTWFHTGAWIKQKQISRQFEAEYYQLDPEAYLLPDTIIPQHMNVSEIREACRALKGRMLRQEVYALDKSTNKDHPYTVNEQNFRVRKEQPQVENLFGVFFAHAGEALNYHYEREPQDPRILHQMTLSVDEFGNATESVSIAHPRRVNAEREEEQKKLLITYGQNSFTRKTDDFKIFRHSVPVRQEGYELSGLSLQGTKLLATEEVYQFIQNIKSANDILTFDDNPSEDRPQLRLIQEAINTYYNDSIDNPINELPVGEVGKHGLVFQTYTLAFTPGLLSEVYGPRLNPNVLEQTGGYIFLEGKWWTQSGRQIFKKSLFYQADQFIDPFRQYLPHPETEPDKNYRLSYDPYKMLIAEVIDPVSNETQAGYDYLVMQPKLITEPNGNRQAAVFDALGMLVGTAVMGKENENQGDDLSDFEPDLSHNNLESYLNQPISQASSAIKKASTRVTYDLWRYYNTRKDDHPEPVIIWSLARNFHAAKKPRPTKQDFQHSFLHQDGRGLEIQTKIQAEPEEKRPTDPRWVGTGRTLYNNKGKPVKQYEPFFSATHLYESEKEMIEQGVTAELHYDPIGRVLRTDLPDGTFTKVTFTAWEQKTFDQNDTVLESQWYQTQGAPDPDGDEPTESNKRTAWLAAQHAQSPVLTYLDTLGRPFLIIEDNKELGKYETYSAYDISGNVIQLTDAKKRLVMRSEFDLQGNALRNHNIDKGERLVLLDTTSNPMMTWDSNGHRIRTNYDPLRRPTHIYVDILDDEGKLTKTILAQRLIYGEWLNDPITSEDEAAGQNLRGQLYLHFDGAGKIKNETSDFKGNLKKTHRQLAKSYDQVPDWISLAGLQTITEIENAATGLLESEHFTFEIGYDALNRPVEKSQYQKTSHKNIIRIKYNQAGLLEEVKAKAAYENSFNFYVKNINYDAKGQRELIEFGNGVKTIYDYNEKTFRLMQLTTGRSASNKKLQNITYTYDPVGNITELKDAAQKEVTRNGEIIKPISRFRYDAIYRLVFAKGREHDGQNSQEAPDHIDIPFLKKNHPNDGEAWRSYQQEYAYDEVGNITMMRHRLTQNLQNGWTRWYYYDERTNNDLVATDPEIMPGSNRLIATTASEDPAAPQLTYQHDANGNMTKMPHLQDMVWDHSDQLIGITLNRTVNTHNDTQKAFYTYNASGQRLRKVVKKNGVTEERIYVGDFEVFRKHRNDANELERETLHIMDDLQRIAMIETETTASSKTPRVRYQLNNHLHSSHLEVNHTTAAKVISYEEYHPFGTTAYAAVNAQTEVSAKRYRYSGKERDEESGLYYYGARYYGAWLGRWSSSDPDVLSDGTNLYQFVLNNPLKLIDFTGKKSTIPPSVPAQPLSIPGSNKPGPGPSGNPGSGQVVFRTVLYIELIISAAEAYEKYRAGGPIGELDLNDSQLENENFQRQMREQIGRNLFDEGLITEEELRVFIETGGLSFLEGVPGTSVKSEGGSNSEKGEKQDIDAELLNKVDLQPGVLLGSVEVPEAATPQVLGQKIEAPIRELLQEILGTSFEQKNAPESTGPDIRLQSEEDIERLGFNIGDIKPANTEGIKKFFEQLDRWNLLKGEEGEAGLFTYDEYGNVYFWGTWKL